MRDIVVYRRGARFEHATRQQQAFCKGLDRHGVKYEIRAQADPRECDLAVIWGHRQRIIMSKACDYLTMEQGYVGDRRKWTSLGFNGLNGRADFKNADSPPDRWDRYHKDAMAVWKTGGDCVVVALQVDGDASHVHIDYQSWLSDTLSALSQVHDLPIFVRHHPVKRNETTWPEITGPIWGVAALVVTFNSNFGVDAVLHGVPTIAMDVGSMAWPVSGHDLTKPAPLPDRSQWASNLAYAQWTTEEIASGEAWAHLTAS